jgi:hypothetical protein
MTRVPKGYISKTIYFVEALPGEEKTRYIEEILDEYYFTKSQDYPKPTINKLGE